MSSAFDKGTHLTGAPPGGGPVDRCRPEPGPAEPFEGEDPIAHPAPDPEPHDPARLHAIKTVHTGAWAFFVVSIAAIPVSAWLSRFDWGLVFALVVLGEVLVLAFNGFKCPLTAIAARYTSDRRPNFDIYLPEWLARWNKEIFGTLYLLGLGFALARWRGWIG